MGHFRKLVVGSFPWEIRFLLLLYGLMVSDCKIQLKPMQFQLCRYRLIGLVVKAHALKEVDQGSISACAVGIFTG